VYILRQGLILLLEQAKMSVIVFKVVIIHFTRLMAVTVAGEDVLVERVSADVFEHGRDVVVVERLTGCHARAQRGHHLLPARVLEGRRGDGQKAGKTE